MRNENPTPFRTSAARSLAALGTSRSDHIGLAPKTARKRPCDRIQSAGFAGGIAAHRMVQRREIVHGGFLHQLGAKSVERSLIKLDAQAWDVVQVKHALLDP